jgi:hypothetical protein
VSDRDAFRADQQERRQFGKAKQHEKRLENATYTAAEVKVLTETARRLGRELGRREALTEVADEMALEQEYSRFVTLQTDHDTWRVLLAAKTDSPASGAVSDERSGGNE